MASLPCYTPGTVDAQRGAGVFGRSIAGLQALNAVGYGRPGYGLDLDLVYNPGGPFLAPDQATLEVRLPAAVASRSATFCCLRSCRLLVPEAIMVLTQL